VTIVQRHNSQLDCLNTSRLSYKKRRAHDTLFSSTYG